MDWAAVAWFFTEWAVPALLPLCAVHMFGLIEWGELKMDTC